VRRPGTTSWPCGSARQNSPPHPPSLYDFEYNLSWLEEHLPGTLGKVISTRRGFVMDSDDHLYVIDFAKGALNPQPPADWVPDIDVINQLGEAKVLDKRVMLKS
jgi:hypothetical protein